MVSVSHELSCTCTWTQFFHPLSVVRDHDWNWRLVHLEVSCLSYLHQLFLKDWSLMGKKVYFNPNCPVSSPGYWKVTSRSGKQRAPCLIPIATSPRVHPLLKQWTWKSSGSLPARGRVTNDSKHRPAGKGLQIKYLFHLGRLKQPICGWVQFQFIWCPWKYMFASAFNNSWHRTRQQ